MVTSVSRPIALVALATLVGLVVGCRPPAPAPPAEASPAVAVAPAPTDDGRPADASDSGEGVPASPGPAPDDEPEPSDGALVPLNTTIEPFERAELPAPDGTAQPSKIAPGTYECKISREYRFRPCTVALDEHGRSILSIPQALVGLEGVLTDEGATTHFDGIKTRERPFGCFSCQERCSIDPASCGCRELPREASAACLMEPVRFSFRKKDGQWRGRIEYHLYDGDLDPEDGNPQYRTEPFVFVMRR